MRPDQQVVREGDAGLPPIDDVRLVSDVETLRALSDPLRLRILEAMVQRRDVPWSVKEIAAALGVPQTRLYHHVEQLLERDLIRVAERRIVSGIIETRYQVAALSFQLDRHMLGGSGEDVRAVLHDTLTTVFDGARDEIERGIATGDIDEDPEAPAERRLLMTRGLARLRPDRATELRRRLAALLEEFADGADEDDPSARAYGLVLAVYPLPRPEPEETRDA